MKDREADFALQRPRPRYDAICAIAKRMGVPAPPFDETDRWLVPAVGRPEFEGAIEMRLLKREEERLFLRRPRPKAEPKGFVYLVRGGDCIKIGTAKDVKKRLSGLQTGSPLKLEMLTYFRGDTTVENALHQRFESLRSHGEWFRAEPPLLAFVEEMKRRQSR